MRLEQQQTRLTHSTPNMPFIPLFPESELSADGLQAIQIGHTQLLVIRHLGCLHVVANRCGHFGVPLEDGTVREGAIFCAQHGIGFDLNTGAVVNRLWEPCDPIPVYRVEVRGKMIGLLAEERELGL